MQNFRVSLRHPKTAEKHTGLVFPIDAKILKPGFRVVEKKNGKARVVSGIEINVTLRDKKSICILKLLPLVNAQFII